jgi:hypothetical protein
MTPSSFKSITGVSRKVGINKYLWMGFSSAKFGIKSIASVLVS